VSGFDETGRTDDDAVADREEPQPLRYGPIDVQLPDTSCDGFSFMHDLAGLFGVEFNAEAERLLRAELRRAKVRGVELDHESDYVFAEARSPAGMCATLGAVARCTPSELFEGCDLSALERSLRAWKRPRGASFRVGDVVAMPLFGGQYGAAQLIHTDSPGLSSVVLLLLDLLANDVPSLAAALESRESTPLAACGDSSVDIASRRWPVIAHQPVPSTIDVPALVARESKRSGAVLRVLESCLGVAPWEARYPHEHDPYLLNGRVPPHRRHRRAIFEHRVREVFHEPPVPPQRGPATLHVLLAHRGSEPVPPLHELPKLDRMRAELARLTSAGHDDEICCGGGVDGFFDVFAQVDDVGVARHQIDQLAAELRVSRDLLVEAYPRFSFDWRGTLSRMR
jgi:hypothetical protein